MIYISNAFHDHAHLLLSPLLRHFISLPSFPPLDENGAACRWAQSLFGSGTRSSYHFWFWRLRYVAIQASTNMGHELVLTPLDATPLHFVGLIDISFGRRGDI